MAIPTYKLSNNNMAANYAASTNSILEITSVLFTNHTVQFLAYLTDISQTFTSTWNSENLFGRNDPVGIFQGTVRTINVAFSLVAGNPIEARNNLVKLDILSSFLYPSYKEVPRRTNPNSQVPVGEQATNTEPDLGNVQELKTMHMYGSPMVKVKFANLINSNLSGNSGFSTKADLVKTGGGDGLLGWIGSLNVNPVMDNGTFIDGMDHLPKTIELSFDFTVTHQATPGYNQHGQWLGDKHFFGTRAAFAGPYDMTQDIPDPYQQDPFGIDEAVYSEGESTAPIVARGGESSPDSFNMEQEAAAKEQAMNQAVEQFIEDYNRDNPSPEDVINNTTLESNTSNNLS